MATPLLVELEVVSFAADDDRQELYYGFKLKHDGVEVMDKAIARRGEQFGASLDRIKTVMCAAAQAQADAGQPIDIDPYAIIKAALRAGVIDEMSLDIE